MFDSEKFISQAEKFKIKGRSFEDADADLLNIDETHIDEHISKQASAIAYYGALYKKALRDYEKLKKKKEFRYKEMYSTSAKTFAGKKATINDIEAKTNSDNQKELEDMDNAIDDARLLADMLEVYWEGWKQKSFALNNYVQLMSAERFSKDSYDGEEHTPVGAERMKKALDIIHKHKNKGD